MSTLLRQKTPWKMFWLRPSGGYGNFATAMDVFSRY